MEGTPALTVSAFYAGVGADGQLAVMLRGHFIAGKSQVVILVDQPHVQPHGTGLAVVAVNADAVRVTGRKLLDNAVAPFRN